MSEKAGLITSKSSSFDVAQEHHVLGHKRADRSNVRRMAIAVVAGLVFLFYLYTPSLMRGCLSKRPRHDDYAARAEKVLKENPLVDGHNDLLILIRGKYGNHIYGRNFTGPFQDGTFPGDTDLLRMEAGHYSGAFWSNFMPCQSNISDFSDEAYGPVVRATFQQLDTYHRLAALFPSRFPAHPTGSPAEAEQAFAAGKLISPLAIEGLHQIGNSPAVLRRYFAAGVRYATLNWNCHNIYSDAALLTYLANGTTVAAPPLHGGLSAAGRALVREMNRLGMLVDLSHTSAATQRDALAGLRADDSANGGEVESAPGWRGALAPPIYSHSSAYALCPHPRNVRDSELRLVQRRGGLVMVNVSPDFIACEAPPADAPPGALPPLVRENATLAQVVRHIAHIGDTIGYEHVGIGTDFSGIAEWPRGFEDVTKLPALVEGLLKHGVTDEQAGMVVGRNLLRVWREAERVAALMKEQGELPLEDETGSLF